MWVAAKQTFIHFASTHAERLADAFLSLDPVNTRYYSIREMNYDRIHEAWFFIALIL
jgi:hypothetical protein